MDRREFLQKSGLGVLAAGTPWGVPLGWETESLEGAFDLVPSHHDESLVDRAFMTKVSGFGGINLAVEVGPNHIVFTGYGSTVYALDAKVPAQPRILGSFLLSDKVWDLRYAAPHLYVANLCHGLAILKVSDDFGDLRLRGRLDTAGALRRLVIEDDLAFLAEGPGGLRIVDVSNPARPREVGRSLCGGRLVEAIFVRDALAYVATTTDRGVPGCLCIVDVSSPEAPVIRACSDPIEARGVVVLDQVAYLAASGRGVGVVNVSNPDHPLMLDPWKDDCVSTFSVLTVAGRSGRLLAGLRAPEAKDGGLGGIVVGDVTSASIPTPPHGCVLTAPEEPWSVRVKGNRAYVAHDDAGLRVVDLLSQQSHGRPFLASSVTYDVTVDRDIAYVADYFTGVSLLDVSKPWSPQWITTWHRPDYDTARPPEESTTARVAAQNGIVLLSRSGGGLYVIDFKNQQKPVFRHFPMPWVADAAVHNRIAYVAEDLVAEDRTRLNVLDLRDVADIGSIKSFDIPGRPRALFLDYPKAYIALLNRGLAVVDVTLPPDRGLIFSGGLDGSPLDIFVSGGFAAVGMGQGEVQLIDVAEVDPSQQSWKELGRTPVFGKLSEECPAAKARAVRINENRLYVGYSESSVSSGLRVFDISDASQPELVAQYDSTRDASCGGAEVFGLHVQLNTLRPFPPSRHVFAATGDTGLWIYLKSRRVERQWRWADGCTLKMQRGPPGQPGGPWPMRLFRSEIR